MRRRERPKSSEWEFQGEVLHWLNEEISKRPGMGLERTTQEPSKITPKRNDLVIWSNRVSEAAFLTFELKTPTTPIADPTLLADADLKAKRWGSPYFAIWNMQAAELYRTPPPGIDANPSHRLLGWKPDPLVNSVDDWMKPAVGQSLKTRAIEILDEAWSINAARGEELFAIDASVFVDRLAQRLSQLREEIQTALELRTRASRALQRELKSIAAAQGFIDFVDDLVGAVAGQYTYRLMGQILFYFALRRKQVSLPPLTLSKLDRIPSALRPYWDEVRRFDYEALFQHSRLDEIVPIPVRGEAIVKSLIEELSAYDWNNLRDDVLGAIFERLIPKDEQHLLGQFYTSPRVADVLLAFAVDGSEAVVLDPGCGSGTFLMRAYDLLKSTGRASHEELLSQLWGFDISPFGAELAAINLFRQDMSAFRNFPRIIPRDFFDRNVGERIPFVPARTGSGTTAELEIPYFSAIVGNPPYLRSQNQDDLDPAYKSKLFQAARRNGVRAAKKTDLFAFFVYKAIQMMRPGSRIAFVISASWLTSDYGASLQWLLLQRFGRVIVISSVAEPFFSQVDINTVLLIAELRDGQAPLPGEQLCFVTLKKKLEDLFPTQPSYWPSLIRFVDEIEEATTSYENERFRLKLIDTQSEHTALADDLTTPRNWSLFLRAPLTYYELFGEAE